MSTYNGAHFLRQQLNSLVQQTYQNWFLTIRDDGSTDETNTIVKEYITNYPQQFFILSDALGNIGVKQSFNELLKKSTAEYIAFCDQDDRWHPNKLQVLATQIELAEKRFKKNFPLLIFSDLNVVDDKMNLLNNSFFKFTGLNPSFVNSNTILFKNVVPGCTMLFNKSLKKLAGEIPQQAVMHDYWLVLFAKYFGKIIYVNQPLVDYRQHDANSLGAISTSTNPIFKAIKNIKWHARHPENYLKKFKPYQLQATAFLNRIDMMDKVKAVSAFVSMGDAKKRLKNKWLMLRYQITTGSFIENIEMFFCL